MTNHIIRDDIKPPIKLHFRLFGNKLERLTLPDQRETIDQKSESAVVEWIQRTAAQGN
jgi:hypothetical protein